MQLCSLSRSTSYIASPASFTSDSHRSGQRIRPTTVLKRNETMSASHRRPWELVGAFSQRADTDQAARGPPKHYRQSTKSQRLTHLSRSTGQSRRLGGRRLVERASAISKRGSSSETSVETCVWLTPPSSLAEDCVSREIPLHRSRRRKVRFTGSTQGGDSPSVTNLFSGPDSRPFEKSPPPTVAPGDTRIKGSQDGEWAPGTGMYSRWQLHRVG